MAESTQIAKIKENPKLWATTIFTLSWIALVQFALFFLAITSLLQADIGFAIGYAIGSLFYLWTTGSLYIALPLNLYFHSKYKVDSNYSKIDLVHRKAIRLLKKLPFRRHLSIAVSISNLGILRLCQGHYDGAEELFKESTSYLQTTRGAWRNMAMIVFYNNLAVAELRQEKLIEAELTATKALEVAELPVMQKTYKKLMGPPLSVLAAVRLRLGELESSREYGEKALECYRIEKNPPGYNDSTFTQAQIFCLLGLALANVKLNKDQKSLEYCNQSLAMIQNNHAALTTLSLEWLNLLANEYLNKKYFEQARTLLDIAYLIGRENPFHPDSKNLLSYYEKLLLLTDREAEVSDMRAWLRHIEDKKALNTTK